MRNILSMLLNTFLFILIYFTTSQQATEVHIPLCAAWKSTGIIVVGSNNGNYGDTKTLLNEPTAVVVADENDTMYVVDSGNNRLMKYKKRSNIGQQVNISTNTNDGNLSNPQDIAIGESGAIYISEAGKNRIVKWTFDPPNIKVLANISNPMGLYLNETTDVLYVVRSESVNYPAVMRYDLNSLEGEEVAAGQYPSPSPLTLLGLYSPVGVYVDRNESIFVAELSGHRITKWLPKEYPGQKIAGTENCGSNPSELCNPTSVILDDTDTMYITDMKNNRILRWAKNAEQGECILGCPIISGNTTTYPLNQPYYATFDSKLNFLVVERYMHRIKRFDFYFEKKCMLKYCRPPNIFIEDHQSVNIRSQSMTFFIRVVLDCYIWLTTDMNCAVVACYPGDLSCIKTIKLDSIVKTFLVPDSFNMMIPPFGLPVGTYNFSCTIKMTLTDLKSSFSTTLQIIRSPITIILLPLGKSTITLGYQQQYTFYPNISSNNSDDSYLQGMRLIYYCRKYPNFDYSMVNGIRLNIDEDSKDPKQSTCFNLKILPQSFVYDDNKTGSSLTIMSRALQINQTYEFYVEMYNDQGLVDKSDAVLVQIQSEDSFFIEISSEFNNLILDDDYQLLNPSTQILLRSSCNNSCPNALIKWKIYIGTINSSDSMIQWEEYPDIEKYLDQWFYGVNSSSFTATDKLFSSNKNVSYWQFEAIYTCEDKHASGLVKLKTNYPPLQKNCSINALDGYTSQLFTITCQNWTDLDGIKDYFLHVISSKSDIQMSIAHSFEPVFSVYLPSGNPKLNYNLTLIVHVRDMLGAWTESNLMTIKVMPDEQIVNQTLNFTENYHGLVKDLLLNGDKNQLINSFSIILNQMALYDQELLMNNSQVQISDLIISSLETLRVETSTAHDANASIIFIKNLNRRSIIREYFLNIYQNSSIPKTIEQLIIASSTVNQLTDTTSEWTQLSLTIASKLCNELAKVLDNLSRQITFEQITLIANFISQCTSNIFTGVNAPLQGRGFIFDHDLNKIFTSSNENKYDYDEYVDYELLEIGIPNCNYIRLKKDQICKEIVIEDDNSTTEVLHNNLELYHQKLLANKLSFEIEETIYLIAKSLRHHLNIHQEFPVIYRGLRMFVEQIYEKDIEDKFIDLYHRNASIYLPKNLTFRQSYQYGFRTTLLPLAPAGGDANVNLSTALTLSILDKNDHQLEINTTNDTLIEMFIPRDINLPIPSFIKKNMTLVIPPEHGTYKVNRQFFIYYINITQINPNLTISIHFELKPFDREISYGIIYKLDNVPAYNSTHISIDGWAMFCHENVIEDMDYYKYYVDNIKTAGHKSFFVGIRELGENEICLINSLPEITDQPYGFLSNYSVRIYSSGCYYLDRKGRWKSNGMKVGEKTNFEQTHCYSNHI